ncbi:MAG: RnfABCDGE type electron transport complex subunit B [Pseudomonadota bacterium]
MDVDALDALLPQTQCRQCGFAGCRPYAQALAQGQAPLDRCVPGGAPLVIALQKMVQKKESVTQLLTQPLAQPFFANSDNKATAPTDKVVYPVAVKPPVPKVAFIDESQCIGCALCLAVCPVDAIIGAPQWMHTVLQADCTGCELCVKPCPVECIEIRDHPCPDSVSGYSVAPERSKNAFYRQQQRRTPEQRQKAERLLALYHPVQNIPEIVSHDISKDEKLSFIEKMRIRAKAKRSLEKSSEASLGISLSPSEKNND